MNNGSIPFLPAIQDKIKGCLAASPPGALVCESFFVFGLDQKDDVELDKEKEENVQAEMTFARNLRSQILEHKKTLDKLLDFQFMEIFLKKVSSKGLARTRSFWERTVFMEYKNPWKLLKNPHAEARGEAPSGVENRNFANWLSVLDKIRTFFRENPDADF